MASTVPLKAQMKVEEVLHGVRLKVLMGQGGTARCNYVFHVVCMYSFVVSVIEYITKVNILHINWRMPKSNMIK